MKKTIRWRTAATSEELKEVAAIDKELIRLRMISAKLSQRRYKIQNRANVRAKRGK